jgi:hypothetical protein
MLSKTKEYAGFASFAQDSGTGVRYMETEESKTTSASTSISSSKRETIGENDDGTDDWIPEEAFKAAHDFRNKCAANVSKALMNTLLQDLNRIWRVREKKQISRIKAEANREVQYLRRELAFKKPYD